MHGTLPLPRLINGILQPSSSKIPHLTIHILRRQTPVSAHRNTRTSLADGRYRRRYQHTHILHGNPFLTAPNQSFSSDEQDGGSSSPSIPEIDDVSAADVGSRARREMEGRISMERLLEENNPERILLGLVTPSIGDTFLANADDDAFTKAICALDPSYFVIPYRDLYRYMKPSLEAAPRFRVLRSLEERMTTFITILDTLVTQRQEQGYTISLDVYRHMLRCAAAGGLGSLARNIFRQALPENHITPDLACYNYFMESLVWNEAYGRSERYHLRAVRPYLVRRIRSVRPVGFTGFGVASEKNRESEESIRLELLGIFNDLVKQGLKADEATFCNLMLAMGREGDIASAKSVLKSVWNIDVDALDRYDEEELESPTFYDSDSPLRPSERLLFTVVHLFSTNNEVAIAGMLLDYISRNYNLDIPESTWTHLLEWTFVISIQHAKWRIDRGLGEGRIARKAVESVYQVSHSEPYNVPPKIVDLIFRAKGRQAARRLHATIDDIRDCIRLLDEERTQVSTLYDKMRGELITKYHDIFKDGVASAEFLALKRKFLFASLNMDCHIQLISVVIRNTFKGRSWTNPNHGTDWTYRLLPQMVKEWADWLPNVLPYYTQTGHVSIMTHDDRTEAILSANSAQTTKTGTMRTLFDTYSPARLRHAAHYVHWGPRGLAAFKGEVDRDDTGLLSDWISRYEQQAREHRLRDKRYGTPRVAAPDHNVDEWIPFSNQLPTRSW